MHISCLMYYDETTSLHYSGIKAQSCIHVSRCRSLSDPADECWVLVPASYLAAEKWPKIFQSGDQRALVTDARKDPDWWP